MDIYHAQTPDTDKRWVLVVDEDELLDLARAINAALHQPPHSEHDCDEDQFACALLYMRDDLRDSDDMLYVWDDTAKQWSVRGS